jgi:hypothetical protein
VGIIENLARLQRGAAKDGRLIRNTGEVHNPADADAFRFRYDLLAQTINNGAAEFGRRCTVTSEVSNVGYYYALSVPQGRELFVWQRTFVLSEGVYEVDVVSAPSGFTGGNNAYKTTLSANGPSTVGAQIVCGVTPVDAQELTVIMQFPFVDTGVGQGNRPVAGADATLGVLTTFTGSTNLIRVRRTVQAEFRSSIFAVAWEEDI